MTRRMKGSWLVFSAADSVSATLKEGSEIEWPLCALRGGHQACIRDGE